MTLADKFAKQPIDPTRQWCDIGKVIDRLRQGKLTGDEDELTALVGALEDKAWTAPAISMALVDEGFGSVNTRHVRQHRRGEHTQVQCAAHDTGVIS